VAGTSLGQGIDFGGGITLDGGPNAKTAFWGWYAQLDSAGKPKWARRLLAYLGIMSVRVAYGGGKLAVGGTYSDPHLTYATSSGEVSDPTEFAIGPAAYVLSCTPGDGYVQWLALYGTGAVYGRDIAVDATGGVVLWGEFDDAAHLQDKTGNDVVARVGSGNNAFAVALTAAGASRWARSFGAVDGKLVTSGALATSASGAIVASGQFTSAVDFGKGTRTAAGASDPFIVSLDPATGATVWDKELSTTADEGAPDIAADGTGDVFANVSLPTAPVPATIDGVALPTTTGSFLAKLSPAGTLLWVRPSAGMGAAAVAVGTSGHLALVGMFQGTLDVGGPTPLFGPDSGSYDTFVVGLVAAP
jgi:hypothetical protein